MIGPAPQVDAPKILRSHDLFAEQPRLDRRFLRRLLRVTDELGDPVETPPPPIPSPVAPSTPPPARTAATGTSMRIRPHVSLTSA
jgi:hypothetical protein